MARTPTAGTESRESGNGNGKAIALPIAPDEEISPQTVAAVRALVAFARKNNIRICSVKLVEDSEAPGAWATLGRVMIQRSHELRAA